jgi:hypothetical protein
MAPNGMVEDQAIKNYRQGRSYLCAGGREGKLYWLAMIKNDHKTQGVNIPRYNDQDRDIFAAMCEADLVIPGVTFGDIYKRQLASALVPLEEGVLEECFYKRIVLVGDSWHKVSRLYIDKGHHHIY